MHPAAANSPSSSSSASNTSWTWSRRGCSRHQDNQSHNYGLPYLKEASGTARSAAAGCGGTESTSSSKRPSHILLVSVFFPKYPITTGVMSKLCGGIARPVRAVVLKKTNVDVIQVLIEFQSVADATRVRRHLNGQDIYTNCCTMDIDFTNDVTKLKVERNDDDSWDFTEFKPKFAGKKVAQKRTLDLNDNEGSPPNKTSRIGARLGRSRRDMRSAAILVPKRWKRSGPRVGILFGLPRGRVTPEHIFNLLSQYGHLVRMKMLYTQPGTAMFEMARAEDLAAVIKNIGGSVGCTLFGSRIWVKVSEQVEVLVSPTCPPKPLEDGRPSFGDFSSSAHFRYHNFDLVAPPSKVVHFNNWPAEKNFKEDVMGFFRVDGVPVPKEVTLFEARFQTSKFRSGLVEFKSTDDAADAIALRNHAEIAGHRVQMAFSVRKEIKKSDDVENNGN